jgi:hypothetical protein
MIQQSSQLGAGYAIAPSHEVFPAVVNPATGSNVVRANAGNTVFRTPHMVAYEPAPGARWPGDLSDKMWLPDGRLVDANWSTKNMLQGAVVFPPNHTGLRGLVPAISMFIGGAMGYKLSGDHKGWGAFTGAIAGGLLGLIFR